MFCRHRCPMSVQAIDRLGLTRADDVTSVCSAQVWFSIGGYRAAKAAFVAIATGVVKSPMSFFETTPTGRILNRLTYDVGACAAAFVQCAVCGAQPLTVLTHFPI